MANIKICELKGKFQNFLDYKVCFKILNIDFNDCKLRMRFKNFSNNDYKF